MIAQKRRMPAAKAFDFFLESSYVEVSTVTELSCVLELAL
jgi:hypothetical protein